MRYRLVVSGRVQGVGYRWSCLRAAEQLGVYGWVRNRPDGSVEVVAEGAVGAVEALVEWCRQGPSHAVVSTVGSMEEAAEGLRVFRILD